MEQDKSKTDETQQPIECCPPSSKADALSRGSDCCGPSRSRGKTIIFVVIILAAVAFGAYSVHKRNAPPATAPCYGVSLKTINALGAQAVGKQAIYFFLFDGDKDQAKNLSRVFEKSIKTLSTNGKRVATFTLYRDEEGFNELRDKLSINSFPCVVVVGRSCSPVVISKGDITENKLASAFGQASFGCAVPCK